MPLKTKRTSQFLLRGSRAKKKRPPRWPFGSAFFTPLSVSQSPSKTVALEPRNYSYLLKINIIIILPHCQCVRYLFIIY